jgi:hypothetical protein
MAKKCITVDGEISESLGPLGVTARRLRGGAREGVLQVELVAGSTRAIVLPDRGLGIWKMSCGDVELGWHSPVAGPVHPRHVPLGEPSGIGWLDGFDELVARCGLVSNGAPDFASNGRLLHGLHGRIANLPARDVQVTLDDSTGTVTLDGAVDETRFLVHALRMHSRIVLQADQPRMAWTDRVENRSDRPTTMQMLYHVNFGPPLLGGGATLEADVEEVAPRDAAAARDVPSWNRYAAPEAGRGEQVHFMRPRADAAGRAGAMLVAADGARAARLSWRAAELPCLTLWKNQGGLADGYATGIEPGTNYPNPRSFEEQQGRVVPLAPHADISFDLTLEVLSGDQVRAAREGITSQPRLHPQPKPGWAC